MKKCVVIILSLGVLLCCDTVQSQSKYRHCDDVFGRNHRNEVVICRDLVTNSVFSFNTNDVKGWYTSEKGEYYYTVVCKDGNERKFYRSINSTYLKCRFVRNNNTRNFR